MTTEFKEFNGPVSLGDLVRACDGMQATEPALIARIAKALGLEIDVDVMVSRLKRDASSSEPLSPASSSLRRTSPRPSLPTQPPTSVASPRRASPPQSETPNIEPVDFEREPIAQPFAAQSGQQLSGSTRFEYFRRPARPDPLLPLFEPRWQPSLIKELITLILPRRELNVPELCNRLAKGEWLRYPPHAKSPLVSLGAQLLIDTGSGMEPFARDRLMLVDSLCTTIGEHRLELRFFQDCPLFGVEDPETLDLVQWAPPSHRCPVLIVSNLGIGVPRTLLSNSTLSDWIRFADRVRRFELPLVFLVPFPRDQAPKQLRRRAAFVTWDRRTTISDVRRARIHQRAL